MIIFHLLIVLNVWAIVCRAQAEEQSGDDHQDRVLPKIDPELVEGLITGEGDIGSVFRVMPRARRYAMFEKTAKAIGESWESFFDELVLLLGAITIFLFFILLTVLAGVFVRSTLFLIGVPSQYVIAGHLGAQFVVIFIGAYLSMRFLGINPGDIVVSLGLVSFAVLKFLGEPLTAVFNGYFVKIDPNYDIGREITILGGRYRGIVHSKRLTELVVDISSPLLGKDKKIEALAAAAKVQHEIDIVAIEKSALDPQFENDYLHVSYTQFLAEERVFHVFHYDYVPPLLPLKRSHMGVHLGKDKKK